MINWKLNTQHPVAIHSIDHLYPNYIMVDNSQNLRFNAKLYEICKPPITVLDFGCGGGGMVKTFIDEGNDAVGLEGSDIPKNKGLGEWTTIPNNLFTCDLTYPFVLHTGDNYIYQFDVVTAWEFVEHIEEYDLMCVFENMKAHLKDDGLFIMSTPSDITHPPKRGYDHHRTRRPPEWWEEQITGIGFKRMNEMEGFFGADWVRRERRNVRNVYKKIGIG
jgi:2-polyprenyl-3-methyl-5-hydroxy-6-metoxy-1,4-benzoquinol methylase